MSNLNPIFEGILSDHKIITKEEQTKMQQYSSGVFGEVNNAHKDLNTAIKKAIGKSEYKGRCSSAFCELPVFKGGMCFRHYHDVYENGIS